MCHVTFLEKSLISFLPTNTIYSLEDNSLKLLAHRKVTSPSESLLMGTFNTVTVIIKIVTNFAYFHTVSPMIFVTNH